jgi:beta-lactamase class A
MRAAGGPDVQTALAPAKNWDPDYTALESQLALQLGRLDGAWSMFFMDLDSGKTFGIQPDLPVPAASCVKVPVVLYASNLISRGQLRWEDRIAYDEDTDWRDGAGSLQATAKDGSKYTIRTLCRKAIVESDNVAWKMLERSLGLDNIADFMSDLGGTLVYPGGQNISTARDMVTYMEAARKFSVQDPANGKDLITNLQHTVWNDGLNRLLRGKVTIAHKEGAITGVANDAGIVYAKHPYVLALMSKNQGSLDVSFKRIAEISRTIWNYQVAIRK